MSINPLYKIIQTEELYGTNAIERNNDFSTKKELIKAMDNFFKNYACPNCDGHRMEGSIIVEIGEVEFFEEVWKKGFFGKKTLITQKFKSVWRVQHTYLKVSGFLSSAGRTLCKSCSWEERGAKGIRWLSINDIRSENF